MLGDVDGTSAAPAISDAEFAVHEQSEYSCRRNDPFRGGYITRAFGAPREGVHALQLEMSQRLYMEEGPPFVYRDDLAAKLRPVLRATLAAFVAAAARVLG
jgi:N-formylglutamate deformylase